MNWLYYLLEANLYLAVFYGVYYLFLRNDTHYSLSRAYLLTTTIVSFIIPVLQLGFLKPVELQLTISPSFSQAQTTPIHYTIPPVEAVSFTWQDGLIWVYLLGVATLFVVFSVKIYQLFKLTRAANTQTDHDYKLIYLDDSNTAFSFFNFLFIGTRASGTDTIIQHELVHIRQKHSVDIVFMELLKIFNWFNPFIYLLQNSLKTLHEYIADERTATNANDVIGYSTFLVNNAYGLGGSSITHSFFNYNLLKKRIIMLNQQRSGSLARLKYLLAVPICAGLLCASTLAFSKTYGFIDIGPHRINKNNKTPQVPEPDNRLLVTQHGLSVITDKFSHRNPNGTVRYYTAHNISNKDVADLKAQGIIINIISNVNIDTIKKHIAPPPPPAPPVSRVKFPLPKALSHKTAKGYAYSESVYTENGKQDITVTFLEKDGTHKTYDKNTATSADITLLKDKYGYVFPAHVKTPPLPPPPVATHSGKNIAPPPPPPAPPTTFTKKGFKYTEDGYAINGKTDFRVIITEKNGEQIAYFKSKATPAEIKLLKDKYGYTFPEMTIHTKLPPPPPAAPSSAQNKLELPTPPVPGFFTELKKSC